MIIDISKFLNKIFIEYTDKYNFENGTTYHRFGSNSSNDPLLELVLLELYWFNYGLHNNHFCFHLNKEKFI